MPACIKWSWQKASSLVYDLMTLFHVYLFGCFFDDLTNLWKDHLSYGNFKFATAVTYISYFVYCICCIIVYVCCTNSAPISHVFFFFHFQSSFTDIAKVLSEFFRDLDIVPSDVIVGLVLLRKRQQLLRLRTIHQVRVLTMTSGFSRICFQKSWTQYFMVYYNNYNYNITYFRYSLLI